MMSYLMKRRTVRLFWIFILMFGGMAGHLILIQVVNGESLSRQAISQQSQQVALETVPRGQILDTRLRPLNPDRVVRRVVVIPAAVTDKDKTAVFLGEVLGIGFPKALTYLDDKSSLIPMDLTPAQVDRIKRQAMTGVLVEDVSVRARKPALASHIIGYLGRQGGAGFWTGMSGLEAYYDQDLKSSKPSSLIRVFFDGRGKFIPGLGYRRESGIVDKNRRDVVLTIDRDIQEIVERVMDRSGVRDGAVVVMDAVNGDILAMAGKPDYSLNPAAEVSTVTSAVYESRDSFVNRSLAGYQPGSVFKVIVAAAALDENIVKPDTVFLCVGAEDDLVSCYEKGGHGLITFAQAMTYSCNPTFARVGLKLGAAKLIDYAGRFGLNNSGLIGYRSSSKEAQLRKIGQPHNMVNASLGQWPVEATVVQVTAAMRTIAGNGMYVEPRIVREIRNYDGSVARTIAPGCEVRAVSARSAGIVRTMLETVTRSGTGKQGLVEPWGSAGKTGSAELGSEKINAWFSGYAPSAAPQYVATVMVNNGVSGGKTAAPIFREIMQEILKRKAGQQVR